MSETPTPLHFILNTFIVKGDINLSLWADSTVTIATVISRMTLLLNGKTLY
jgi:hypothetical protein